MATKTAKGNGSADGDVGETAALSVPNDHMRTIIQDTGVSFLTKLTPMFDWSEVDKVVPALVKLRVARGNALDLLRGLVKQEVDATELHVEATLFRGNSVATKYLKGYADAVAAEYRRDTLGPPLLAALNDEPIELDPNRLGPEKANDEAYIADMRERVKKAVTLVLDAISESAESAPMHLKKACTILRLTVREKFPKSAFIAVGAIIFLRFLLPALLTPDGLGIVTTKITDKGRNSLKLISKIVLALANDAPLQKEEHLRCMNEFVDSKKPQMRQYLTRMSEQRFELWAETSLPVHVDGMHKELARVRIALSRMSRDKLEHMMGEGAKKDRRVIEGFEAVIALLDSYPTPKDDGTEQAEVGWVGRALGSLRKKKASGKDAVKSAVLTFAKLKRSSSPGTAAKQSTERQRVQKTKAELAQDKRDREEGERKAAEQKAAREKLLAEKAAAEEQAKAEAKIAAAKAFAAELAESKAVFAPEPVDHDDDGDGVVASDTTASVAEEEAAPVESETTAEPFVEREVIVKVTPKETEPEQSTADASADASAGDGNDRTSVTESVGSQRNADSVSSVGASNGKGSSVGAPSESVRSFYDEHVEASRAKAEADRIKKEEEEAWRKEILNISEQRKERVSSKQKQAEVLSRQEKLDSERLGVPSLIDAEIQGFMSTSSDRNDVRGVAPSRIVQVVHEREEIKDLMETLQKVQIERAIAPMRRTSVSGPVGGGSGGAMRRTSISGAVGGGGDVPHDASTRRISELKRNATRRLSVIRQEAPQEEALLRIVHGQLIDEIDNDMQAEADRAAKAAVVDDDGHGRGELERAAAVAEAEVEQTKKTITAASQAAEAARAAVEQAERDREYAHSTARRYEATLKRAEAAAAKAKEMMAEAKSGAVLIAAKKAADRASLAAQKAIIDHSNAQEEIAQASRHVREATAVATREELRKVSAERDMEPRRLAAIATRRASTIQGPATSSDHYTRPDTAPDVLLGASSAGLRSHASKQSSVYDASSHHGHDTANDCRQSDAGDTVSQHGHGASSLGNRYKHKGDIPEWLGGSLEWASAFQQDSRRGANADWAAPESLPAPDEMEIHYDTVRQVRGCYLCDLLYPDLLGLCDKCGTSAIRRAVPAQRLSQHVLSDRVERMVNDFKTTPDVLKPLKVAGLASFWHMYFHDVNQRFAKLGMTTQMLCLWYERMRDRDAGFSAAVGFGDGSYGRGAVETSSGGGGGHFQGRQQQGSSRQHGGLGLNSSSSYNFSSYTCTQPSSNHGDGGTRDTRGHSSYANSNSATPVRAPVDYGGSYSGSYGSSSRTRFS